MATAKATILTRGIDPCLKAALITAAEREHHSLANMVGTIVRDCCKRLDVPVPVTPKLALKGKRNASPRSASGN